MALGVELTTVKSSLSYSQIQVAVEWPSCFVMVAGTVLAKNKAFQLLNISGAHEFTVCRIYHACLRVFFTDSSVILSI